MIRLLIFLSIVFISFAEPVAIPYRKLSWSDFKRKPNKESVALSMVLISFETDETDGKFIFRAYSKFDPSRSFTTTNKPRILKHEQLHFDITELMVRRLRMLLKGVTSQKEADDLYHQVVREWMELEKQYDRETNFSINQAEQERWETEVSKKINYEQPGNSNTVSITVKTR